MMIKPQQLGDSSINEDELVKDKKLCHKFGPCGIGEKAIYLNSFYFERRYYVPLHSVKRVFKRVATPSSVSSAERSASRHSAMPKPSRAERLTRPSAPSIRSWAWT